MENILIAHWAGQLKAVSELIASESCKEINADRALFIRLALIRVVSNAEAMDKELKTPEGK